MRIGFDAKRIFQNATGLGNYSRSVVRDLAELYPEHDYFLFTPNANHQLPFEVKGNVKTIVGRGSVWRSFGIRRDILRNKIDVFHGLSNEIPFSINKTDSRSVVTIHDLIFDLFPHQYPGVDRTVYELKTRFAVNHADVIIAASESTKKDIQKTYGTPEEKIQVVYQSCDPIFYQGPVADISQYALPQQYMLYVGSVTERKNLLAVAQAYLHLRKEDRIPCVIVGHGKRYAEVLCQFIADHKLTHWFMFLENVPTEHLPALYHQATCFIYPSLYEGFGIPILESMASGCPVLTSDVSSLPEVGGDAAMYFDPQAPESIAAIIAQVLGDSAGRAAMRERGLAMATHFDRKAQARQLMDIYKQ